MLKDENLKQHLFICECGDTADQIIMQYWKDDEDPFQCVYVSFYLRKQPWYKRIILGIKYIFGKRSNYGEFGEVILRPEDYTKMEDVAAYLKQAIENRKTYIEKHKKDIANKAIATQQD